MTITRTTPLDELPELLRVHEVAAWTDASTGVVYEAIRSGTLDAVRLGRLVRVPRAGLAEWIRAGSQHAD